MMMLMMKTTTVKRMTATMTPTLMKIRRNLWNCPRSLARASIPPPMISAQSRKEICLCRWHTHTHFCHVLVDSRCYFWFFVEFPETNLSDQIFSRTFPLTHHHLKIFSVFRRVMYWGLSRSQQIIGGWLRTVKATEEWFQKPFWRYTTPHLSEFSKRKMIFSWKAIGGHFLIALSWSIQIARCLKGSALVSLSVKAFIFFQAASGADEDNESNAESDDEDLSEDDEEQDSEELSEFGEKERFSISTLFVHVPHWCYWFGSF